MLTNSWSRPCGAIFHNRLQQLLATGQLQVYLHVYCVFIFVFCICICVCISKQIFVAWQRKLDVCLHFCVCLYLNTFAFLIMPFWSRPNLGPLWLFPLKRCKAVRPLIQNCHKCTSACARKHTDWPFICLEFACVYINICNITASKPVLSQSETAQNWAMLLFPRTANLRSKTASLDRIWWPKQSGFSTKVCTINWEDSFKRPV